ncbi:PH domain-containing protein [Streptomyces cyaneochromogenes]|uniref:PH domain-containing protein n=1 Tax=Streptomyces cyaneochromogenes TaxID=2496836 RepID=A0A3Q9EWD6_9ACTN|nr:PH domain-containing protein [Streptomyces cyaneochromogenes]AZQ37007.1 PH domain-containing protein [Streptomyces cyaneochromogenes]
MTTPEPQPPTPDPVSRDRIYRSPMGIVGGVLLLVVVLWLGIDALVRGEGRTQWLALAALILIVPLVSAFTLRPAVYANEERLRIRNPLRIIVLPWGQIASLRSGYTNEAIAKSGTKFQLWAIPVSLRARKKAARRSVWEAAERNAAERSERGGRGGGGTGSGGFGFGTSRADFDADGPARAESDKIIAELRDLLAHRENEESAQGEVTVRWAYEVVAPAFAGAVLLLILLLMP